MKKQWIALLLALALALPLCAVPALAQTDPASQEEETAVETGETIPGTGEASVEAESLPSDNEEESVIVVQPEETSLSPLAGSAMDDELVFTGESDFRYLGFEDLKDKVLEGSYTARMLEESIASIDAMDYTKMHMELASQMNSLEAAQAMYASIPVASQMEGAMQGYIISNLASTYASLSSTVSDLATGKLQKDAAAAKRQLQNAQDLTVVGAESLYFAILELEQTKATLQRNLSAVDRSMEEMETRYNLGQISALTLEQVKNGRANLQSSLSTLEMNLRRCKLQMQSMVGSTLSGSLTLGALPELDPNLVKGMNYEQDLDEAKTRSYTLFAAKKKLDEASDTYDDTRANYAQNTYNVRSARHTYEAALYEYKTSVQNFEMNFRNSFDSVVDYQQILNAAQTSLAFQESTYAAQKLKYEQGTISQNALLTAEDELAAAKDTVASAKRNLFTAFRTYYWAVQYGVTSSAQTGT